MNFLFDVEVWEKSALSFEMLGLSFGWVLFLLLCVGACIDFGVRHWVAYLGIRVSGGGCRVCWVKLVLGRVHRHRNCTTRLCVSAQPRAAHHPTPTHHPTTHQQCPMASPQPSTRRRWPPCATSSNDHLPPHLQQQKQNRKAHPPHALPHHHHPPHAHHLAVDLSRK